MPSATAIILAVTLLVLTIWVIIGVHTTTVTPPGAAAITLEGNCHHNTSTNIAIALGLIAPWIINTVLVSQGLAGATGVTTGG